MVVVFRRRFFGLFPIVTVFGCLAVLFGLDKVFLGVGSNLGPVAATNESLNAFPVFAVELQTFIANLLT